MSPDASGRIPPVSVPKVWPGHRDYTEPELPSVSDFLERRFRLHPHGFGAWEVVEDEPQPRGD